MKNLITRLAAVSILAGSILAQQPSAPKPGPEHKRLAYFVGNWTSEGEMKPSPFGPGGKFSSTDRNEWLEGGFFVIIRSTGKGPMGPMTELAVLGYNADEKTYTFNGFNSMGENNMSKGTVKGDTWTWHGDSKMQGKVIKGRYTMKELSPTSYTFKFETSTDGKTWTNTMEGKSTKSK